MKAKATRCFHIKIFNEHGRFVEDFALSADTRRNLKIMVRARMRENGMSEGYMFKVSYEGY